MPSNHSPEGEDAPLLEGQNQNGCCRIKTSGPDSAWSCLVAFANFLVSFIIVGLGRMSGILYVEFMHIFSIDRKAASFPLMVQQAGRNLFGPLAGIIGQKYGMRAVTILGGVIGALSAYIIYFKMDITSITILWGLFFGLSTALTTTLNQISIDQYFEKHRATAGGFAFSGGCLGAFFFPIVIETLIQHYTLRGTFLVLGSIILFVIPAAVLLVEPPWKQEPTVPSRNTKSYGALKADEPSTSDDSIETIKANNKIAEADSQIFLTNVNFHTLQENSDMVFQLFSMDISDCNVRPQTLYKEHVLNELECIYTSIVDPKQKSVENKSYAKIPSDSGEESNTGVPKLQCEYYDSEDIVNEHYLSRMFDQGVTNVYIQTRLRELHGARGLQLVAHFPYPDQPKAWRILVELRKLFEILNGESYIQTMYKSAHTFAEEVTGEPEWDEESEDHPNTFWNHIMTAVKLHGNPLFLLICICRGVFMLTFIPVVTIVVDFAIDKGLPKSDGKYVIAILSLGDLIGRLCLGWITDRGCLSLPRYMLVVMIILGGSTATLPLMTSRASFMVAILIFGILQGSLFVRHSLLVSQYMEKHEQSIGMGFINFLSGFLGFALPAFIGYFRDYLGSYDKMFYLNGIICAIVGLLWLLEPCFIVLGSCNSRKSERNLSQA